MKRIYFLTLLFCITVFFCSSSTVFATQNGNKEYVKILETIEIPTSKNKNVKIKLFKDEIYPSKFTKPDKSEVNIKVAGYFFTLNNTQEKQYDPVKKVKTIDNINIEQFIKKYTIADDVTYLFDLKKILEELRNNEIQATAINIASLSDLLEYIDTEDSNNEYMSLSIENKDEPVRLFIDGAPTIFFNFNKIDEFNYDKIKTNYGFHFLKDTNTNHYYFNTDVDKLTADQQVKPGKYDLGDNGFLTIDNRFLIINDKGEGKIRTFYNFLNIFNIIICLCIAALFIILRSIFKRSGKWKSLSEQLQAIQNKQVEIDEQIENISVEEINEQVNNISADIEKLKMVPDFQKVSGEYDKMVEEIRTLKQKNNELKDELTEKNQELEDKIDEVAQFEELDSKVFWLADYEQFIKINEKFLTDLKEIEEKVIKMYLSLLRYSGKYKDELIVFSQMLSKFFVQKQNTKLSKWESILELMKYKGLITASDVAEKLKMEQEDMSFSRLEILLFQEVYKIYLKSLLLLLEESKNLNKITGKNDQISEELDIDQKRIIEDAKRYIGIEIRYASLFKFDKDYPGILEAVNKDELGHLYYDIQNELLKDKIIEIKSYGMEYKLEYNKKTKCIIK
jgi:hypothetical protein